MLDVFDKYFVAKYIYEQDCRSFDEFIGQLLCDIRANKTFGWKCYGRLFQEQDFRQYVCKCLDDQKYDILVVDVDFLKWYITHNFDEGRVKYESERYTGDLRTCVSVGFV